jgi:hypothetical protein
VLPAIYFKLIPVYDNRNILGHGNRIVALFDLYRRVLSVLSVLPYWMAAAEPGTISASVLLAII